MPAINRPGLTLAVAVAAVLAAVPTAAADLRASASAATSLTIDASAPSVPYGASVTLSGLDVPAAAESLVVESRESGGEWVHLADVTSDAGTGAWSTTTVPSESTEYRVRTGDSSVISSVASVAVIPQVSIHKAGTPRPFLGAPLTIQVTPSTYSGPMTLVSRGVSGTATRRLWVTNGRARGYARTDGIGRFQISGTVHATSQFASGSGDIWTAVRGRTLRLGDSGPDVAALKGRLRALGFLLPNRGRRYDFSSSEATMAFNKAYRMPRLYTWGHEDWLKISTLRAGPTVRDASAGTHVEVDKGRQIMMLVTDGKVVGIVAVSTGATGNTPLGRFRIFDRMHIPGEKDFMGFVGNFGIHGYDFVPPYPASHGCVREPNWAADWMWNHTHIGTVVLVYR
jgi:N-acetylmuramoyl-L-alanine amidase